VTLALPENETSFTAVPSAHARALWAAKEIVPALPVRTALPVNTTQVLLTNRPLAEPVSLPGPMMRPPPVAVALPEAVVPLTAPDPWPVYVAVNACGVAASAGDAATTPAVRLEASAIQVRIGLIR
jgi:hypothetical protein